MMRVSAILLSVVMIFLIVIGQVVQYHHHDEHDEICLCLDPGQHCHHHEHNDCNHDDDPGCSLHFEDSIIVDANDHILLLVSLALVSEIFNLSLSLDSVIYAFGIADAPPIISVTIGSLALRAPPVA